MLPYEPYFSQVYGETYRPLLKQAMLRLSNPLDTEDALQNVYLRFLNRVGRHGHEDISDPEAFLFKLLRNEIAERYSQRAEKQAHEQPLFEATLPAGETDLEVHAATRQEALQVFAAAKALAPECYRTFVLYYGFEMSVDEIASALHIGREAVKSRLFRARNGIRNQLIQKGDIAL